MTTDESDKLPAIASHSPVKLIQGHTGAVARLRLRELENCAAADRDSMFAQPWGKLVSAASGAQEQSVSILLSEVSLGMNENQDFHFETLLELSLRVVVAPFFGPVLLSEAVKFGILLIPLPVATIGALGERLDQCPTAVLTVDLRKQTLAMPGGEAFAFETHPWLRTRLLYGMDNLDEQFRLRQDARDFRSRDRDTHPWLYRPAAESEPDSE